MKETRVWSREASCRRRAAVEDESEAASVQSRMAYSALAAGVGEATGAAAATGDTAAAAGSSLAADAATSSPPAAAAAAAAGAADAAFFTLGLRTRGLRCLGAAAAAGAAASAPSAAALSPAATCGCCCDLRGGRDALGAAAAAAVEPAAAGAEADAFSAEARGRRGAESQQRAKQVSKSSTERHHRGRQRAHGYLSQAHSPRFFSFSLDANSTTSGCVISVFPCMAAMAAAAADSSS